MRKAPYRKRLTSKKTTGIVRHTRQDAIGFCDPLCRYGDLPTNILGDFYNLANGTRPESVSYRDRLTRLFHETEGFAESRRLLYRPGYQKRRGQNAKAKYRKTNGTALTAYRFGVYDAQSLQWLRPTQIVRYEDGKDFEPSEHDEELAVVAANLEIGIRRHLKFLSHIDILRNASEAAQTARSPLSVPIPKLSFKFPNQPRSTVIDNTFAKPDYLCGAEYPGHEWKFFWLEYDRATETGTPTKDLEKQSLLRKVLACSAISAGNHPIYETYFKIPNMLYLFVFWDRRRETNFHALVRAHATYVSPFLTTVIPPVDAVNAPWLTRDIFKEPWRRADGSLFSLETGKEVVKIGNRHDDSAGQRPDRAA